MKATTSSLLCLWIVLLATLGLKPRPADAASFVVLGLDQPNQIAHLAHYDLNSGALLGDTALGTNFGYCTSLAFGPNGNLFVAEFSTRRIHRFDYHTGDYLGIFATITNYFPYGVTFGPDGNLYVGLSTAAGVQRFNGNTGAFIDTFLPSSGIPSTDFGGMTFRAGSVFVAYTGNPNGYLRQYNASSGALISTHYSSFPGNGPRAPNFGPDGFLYVPVWQTTYVSKFDGTTYSYLSNVVTGAGTSPISLEFTSTNMLVLSDITGSPNVKRYDLQTGAFVSTLVASSGTYNRALMIKMVPEPVNGPRLTAIAVSPTQTQITWRTLYNDFLPEFTTNIAASVWSPVTNTVTVTNDQYTFTVDPRLSGRFFRLRKP